MQIQMIPLFSGSSGNCVLVQAGNTCVLVDAGVSCRAVTQALNRAGYDITQISGILVTHEHADHIKGIPMIAKKFGTNVYASEGTWRAMHGKFRDVPHFCPVIHPGGSFYIGELSVEPFPLSHDANEPTGYAFFYGGEKAALATDTGYISRGLMRSLEGAATVVLESNHDPQLLQSGPYPYVLKQRVASRRGHLSNSDCARALVHLAQNGTKKAILAHLSRQNNDPDLAMDVNRTALLDEGIDLERDFSLTIAPPAAFDEDTALSPAAIRR